jgi:hypothetical protein
MRRRPDLGSGGQTVRSPAAGAGVVSSGAELRTGLGTAVGATPTAGSAVGRDAAAQAGLGPEARDVDVDLRSVIRRRVWLVCHACGPTRTTQSRR